MSGLLCPGIAQGDAAVEHRRVAAMVVAVGDEITDAFELEMLFGCRLRRGGFDVTGDGAA
jgi:hypothetical protein